MSTPTHRDLFYFVILYFYIKQALPPAYNIMEEFRCPFPRSRNHPPFSTYEQVLLVRITGLWSNHDRRIMYERIMFQKPGFVHCNEIGCNS